MSDEKKEHDGICAHCGGMVDADGMSMGGIVEDMHDEFGADRVLPEEVGDRSPQNVQTQRMREFGLSLKGRR